MQKPVRYYIVQDQDQPVVRSVPVAVPTEAPRPIAAPVVEDAPGIVAVGEGRARVSRLVRAAVRRNRRLRHGD